MSIRLQVKEVKFEKLNKVLKDLQNDAEVRIRINQAIADKCDPYVPYQTGQLAGNIEVNEKGIRYKQPYAKEQYYGTFEHNKTIHPLASSQWDKAMMQNHKDELNQEIKDIVNDRLKELNDG